MLQKIKKIEQREKVSKETVVLLLWESIKRLFGIIN